MQRDIVATFIRRGVPQGTRRYIKIDNAIPRATQLLMQHGRPRDVVEFSHAVTGLQLGTIRVHAGGKLTTDYIWD
jgi:hypothetical protein